MNELPDSAFPYRYAVAQLMTPGSNKAKNRVTFVQTYANNARCGLRPGLQECAEACSKMAHDIIKLS